MQALSVHALIRRFAVAAALGGLLLSVPATVQRGVAPITASLDW